MALDGVGFGLQLLSGAVDFFLEQSACQERCECCRGRKVRATCTKRRLGVAPSKPWMSDKTSALLMIVGVALPCMAVTAYSLMVLSGLVGSPMG